MVGSSFCADAALKVGFKIRFGGFAERLLVACALHLHKMTVMNEENELELCEDCEALVSAGRYVPPHKNLTQTKSIKVSSAMGPADELHYKCANCGHEWLYETGSCGYGWII